MPNGSESQIFLDPYIKWIIGIIIEWGLNKLITRIKKIFSSIFFPNKLSKESENIARAFEDYTNQFLNQKPYEIIGLKHIKRQEIDEIAHAWENGLSGLILVGTAGSGKSGLVLDLAKDIHAKKEPILFIRATDFNDTNDPISALEQLIPLQDSLINSLSKLSKEKEFFLIIDQVDSIVDSAPINGFVNFIKTISLFEKIRVLVVSRIFEADNSKFIKALNFSTIISREPNSETAKDYLQEIGLPSPGNDLIELSKNLLNLSLIAELVASEKNVSDIISLAQLWEKYILSVKEREGDITLNTALILADQCQKKGERNFTLNFLQLPSTKKLNSRGVIIQIPGTLKFRFRHDQMQTFFCAYSLFLDLQDPEIVIDRYGRYNSKDVLLWMCKLYGLNAPKDEAIFVRKILENEKKIPYYTKIRVLDYYLHLEKLDRRIDTVLVILDLIQKQGNLRERFFNGETSFAWAEHLYNAGLLSNPPDPEEINGNQTFRGWDAQFYLIAVASKVPEVVMNHLKSINGSGWYLGFAIEALCKIDIEFIEEALPIIENWFSEGKTSENLYHNTLKIIEKLIRNEKIDSAIELFSILSAPPTNAQSLNFRFYKKLFGYKNEHSTAFDYFKNHLPLQIINILETHLLKRIYGNSFIQREDIQIEAKWSRNAIEDTDQDNFYDYPDAVICALRDTLLNLNNINEIKGQEITRRYLNETIPIFRRLGLHAIGENQSLFLETIAVELLNSKKYEDNSDHHEFFLLLQKGYPYLENSEKQKVINIILDGPDPIRLENLYEKFYQSYYPEKEEFLLSLKESWIRDRLWMIKDYLDQNTESSLKEIIRKIGEPTHPEFLSWMSEVHMVIDGSPYSIQELEELPPDTLFERVKNWRPSPERFSQTQPITVKGFAQELANLICLNPEPYGSHILQICLFRPEYGFAIFNKWGGTDFNELIQWPIVINLINEFLMEEKVWKNDSEIGPDHNVWRDVRLSIVNLLKISVTNKEKQVPEYLLGDVKELLILLLNDQDPIPEVELPQEGLLNINDPRSVAINHVRPIALSGLIFCARLISLQLNPENGSVIINRVMNDSIRDKLSQKLDIELEPSNAVRSVFGQYTPLLFWLDQNWITSHLDQIFPNISDDENNRLFRSAWDSYISNKYYSDVYEIMRPKYAQAIEYLSKSELTDSDFEMVIYLAGHLLFEFLFSDEDPDEFLEQQNLLLVFYKTIKRDLFSKISTTLWQICFNNPKKLQVFWPKAIALWGWRNNQSISSSSSVDFEEEMQGFARLLDFVPESDSFGSLNSLLEGLLPHLSHADVYNPGWRAIETFLSREIKNQPVDVIKYYRNMCEQKKIIPNRLTFNDNDNVRIILEVATDNPESRDDALALIDFFAQHWENYDFQYLYEKYTG